MGKIQYDIVEIPNLKGDSKLYRVKVVNSCTKSFEKVKKDAEHCSMMTRADVEAVATNLSEQIAETLKHGDDIHLKGIGYFSLSIRTGAVQNPRKINAKNIQVNGINFKPDKHLLGRLMDNCEFEKVQSAACSVPVTMQEMLSRLQDFFRTNKSISRREFQRLMQMTKGTAIRRIDELCKGNDAVLRKEGSGRTTMYYARSTSTI